MILRTLLTTAVLALAACASTPTLDQSQKRAVAAIQTAQQESTAALVGGRITLAQDRNTQARLIEARRAVLSAKTAEEAAAVTKAAGVQP